MNYVKHLNMYGVDVKEIPCIRGEGEPNGATAGAVGCLYMDTISGYIFKCVEDNGTYTWVNIVGDVESALDEIIAIQNALIGGEVG